MTIPLAKSRRFPLPQLVAATAITAITILLIWAVASMPTICPAIYPAPPSCAPDARTGPAAWGTGTVGVLYVAALVAGLSVAPARREMIFRLACVVLAVVGVGAIGMTLFASGFAVGF